MQCGKNNPQKKTPDFALLKHLVVQIIWNISQEQVKIC